VKERNKLEESRDSRGLQLGERGGEERGRCATDFHSSAPETRRVRMRQVISDITHRGIFREIMTEGGGGPRV